MKTNKIKVLDIDFYQQTDVVDVSRQLLGKVLVTHFEGERTSGKIVETEAYRGPDDKACHAFNNRRTNRTKTMFEAGGVAYVYLCYGIHSLFNVVTGLEDQPHAVLIRAIEPIDNKTLMLHRRKMTTVKPQLTAGPGVLSKALGITTQYTGLKLTKGIDAIWIENHGEIVEANNIIASPRVGVAYAKECADWNWRFRIKNSKWTSPAK